MILAWIYGFKLETIESTLHPLFQMLSSVGYCDEIASSYMKGDTPCKQMNYKPVVGLNIRHMMKLYVSRR